MDVVAGGEDENRRGVAKRAGVLQHLDAVLPGQPQIQQDDVVVLAGEGGFGGVAVVHPIHRVAVVFQAADNGLGNHGVVFNKQNAHGMSFGFGRVVFGWIVAGDN